MERVKSKTSAYQAAKAGDIRPFQVPTAEGQQSFNGYTV